MLYSYIYVASIIGGSILIVNRVINKLHDLYENLMNEHKNIDPILKKLLSGDFNDVKSAFKEISHMKDIDRLRELSKEIEVIRESTTLVLDDNYPHFKFSCGTIAPVYHFRYKGIEYPDFAVMKLEYVKNNNDCLCKLYAVASIYSPLDEERKGNVEILSTYKLNSRSNAYYLCQCTFCLAEYKVYPREYHAPWFEWVEYNK